MSRIQIARLVLRLFPLRWRQRYEDDVLDTLTRAPIRVADLIDLARTAGDEWERRLAGSAAGIATTFAVGYAVLGLVYLGVQLALNLPTIATLWLGSGFGLYFRVLGSLPTMFFLFLLPMYVAGVVINVPLLTGLRLARHRVPLRAARWAAAIGFAAWGEWILFKMEWFDVWRHGVPGLSYWLFTLVPWGVAWASAGAVLGGTLARTDADTQALGVRTR